MLLLSLLLYFLAIQRLKECSIEIGCCVSDAAVDVQQVIAKVKKAQVCLYTLYCGVRRTMFKSHCVTTVIYSLERGLHTLGQLSLPSPLAR